MLYNRDKEIIKKLRLNAKGEYNRFTQGDVEYIISAIVKYSVLEDETSKSTGESIYD